MTPQPFLLGQLDVLIGIAVVMSVASLFVTLVVQAAAAFLGLRGADLRWGIATLLHELDTTGAITKPAAEQIAADALSHPLVSDSTSFGRLFGMVLGGSHVLAKRWKLATAIRADELVAILQSLETDAGATNDWKAILSAPSAGTAAQVQATIQDVGTWFDSAMDRVSQRFATHTRVMTIAVSFVVAIVLHVDVLGIYTRLASDAPLRASFVAQALAATESAAAKAVDPQAPKEQREQAAAAYRDASVQWQATLNTIGPLGFLPAGPGEVFDFTKVSLLGVLLGGMLLSLGAPFWFNLLSRLTSLRPILAKKVDEEPRATS